jgi:putative hydrolase of HD superfamily
MEEDLQRQLEFILELDRLKGVQRQTLLADGSRQENSAEHSWHLATLALVLGEHAPPGTDLGRVITMLVLHDIVEIDAGDLYVYAPAAAQASYRQAEAAAAERIFGLLPPDQGRRLRAIWEEFEDRRTAEARFARALDRLQPMLLNYHTGGRTWREHGVSAGQVLANVELVEEGSATLGRYARELIASAVRQGFLPQ